MPAVKRKIICYAFIMNSHSVINAAYASQIHSEILSILTGQKQFVKTKDCLLI
jgi:hypothetical protein